MTSDDIEVTLRSGGTPDRTLPCLSDDVSSGRLRHSQFHTPNKLNLEMLSQLVHRTNAILRGARPFIPWLPSSLGPLQCSHIFRAYSWSGQSETANWTHLNDIYSRVVDVKSKGHHSTPDERWAIQSRSRMANLKPPKGPYAGTTFFLPFETSRLSHISIQEGVSK